MVKSGSSLKAIYGGVSTYNRYISDIQESNPGGYALNNIEESELVFIESLGCYIRKDYEYLIQDLNKENINNKIYIRKEKDIYKYRILYNFVQNFNMNVKVVKIDKRYKGIVKTHFLVITEEDVFEYENIRSMVEDWCEKDCVDRDICGWSIVEWSIVEDEELIKTVLKDKIVEINDIIDSIVDDKILKTKNEIESLFHKKELYYSKIFSLN